MLQASGQHGFNLPALDTDAVDVVEADEDTAGLVLRLSGPGLELSSALVVPAESLQGHVALVYAATILRMSLVPLIAFGVAALALVVLGIAGPVYRLGATLATAYGIMRLAEYIGLAASLIAIGSAIYSYRGRKWTGTFVSVLALIIGLSAVAIPMAWQRRAQRLPSINDITT